MQIDRHIPKCECAKGYFEQDGHIYERVGSAGCPLCGVRTQWPSGPTSKEPMSGARQSAHRGKSE
jgi:hypothetical protein